MYFPSGSQWADLEGAQQAPLPPPQKKKGKKEEKRKIDYVFFCISLFASERLEIRLTQISSFEVTPESWTPTVRDFGLRVCDVRVRT